MQHLRKLADQQMKGSEEDVSERGDEEKERGLLMKLDHG